MNLLLVLDYYYQIIIRLPLDYSSNDAQEVIDYLKFTSIRSINEVTDEQIEELSNEVNSKIWEKLNAKYNLVNSNV